MSGIINKVKDALHHDSTSTTGTTHGTHGTHTTGTHTIHTTGAGYGTAEGVAGPHNARVANAADPRVDSDLDGSRNAGAHSTTRGTHTTHTTGAGYGTAEGVAGPHSSRLANAADPRVDSDLDGSRNAGAHSTTHGTHTTGSGLTGTTYGTHTGTTGAGYGPTGTSTNAGPHNSNLMNKMDPRVDSDMDGSRNAGVHSSSAYSGTHAGNTGLTGTTGTTGGISHSTNAGPHDSNMANKMDPRVDSDLDGRGNRHGASTGGIMGASGSHATPGSGTAQNTAGPHNSDMMNKLDPRVDSDRDGSKTFGGNKTHANRDPSDAAQVPPSVLAEHVGAPTVLHDDKHHNHAGRHGSASHQETERAI